MLYTDPSGLEKKVTTLKDAAFKLEDGRRAGVNAYTDVKVGSEKDWFKLKGCGLSPALGFHVLAAVLRNSRV